MSTKAAAPSQSEGGVATRPVHAESKSTAAPGTEMAPGEIRAVREGLGLSQAEAGELLGGGPRAFTKYEAGAVKPSAAIVTLLRLLEHDPTTIRRLQAIKSLPMTPMPDVSSPFQISGEHVERLNELSFPPLLRRLLHAEAQAHDLPTDGIHVASAINAPDGGEDGRIEWPDGPERTPSLPCRVTQFQLKSGPVAPKKAADDVLRDGQVKQMVRDVLEARGHYRMLCAKSYPKKDIERREDRIREAILSAGVSIEGGQVTFWDADQIAAWVNQHPTVAIWIKEQTQPGTIGPFRSWTHWSGRADHDGSPWVEDERLPLVRERLRTAAMTSQSVLRLVGPAGIGKSRLALEALGSSEDVSNIVLYADETEAGRQTIIDATRNLADTGSRSVVVVNRCTAKTHRVLADVVRHRSSRLALVTLDDEIPAGTLDETTIKVDEAPSAVVEAIIDRVLPNLPSVDRDLLAHFADGFPRIATDVAQAWRSARPIAHVEPEDVVNAFVLGRQPLEHERTLESAMLVAAFGLVVAEPKDGQLEEVASFHHDLKVDDLRISIVRLVERGVVRRKGRFRVLQPRPIAMRLAERQWRDWTPAEWDRILVGGTSHRLSATAARMLARLNTTSVAEEVVGHVCRPDGPLADFVALAKGGQAEVLSALAEVAPDVVLETLERTLGPAVDMSKVSGDTRRHVVWALEKIAFQPDTFDGAARLLLRLAVAENETWTNNATGLFTGFFHPRLGATTADGDARLALLDEISDAADDAKQLIVVEALVSALETMGSRMIGAEAQGSKPALSAWYPSSMDALARYETGCISRLACFAANGSSQPSIERAQAGLAQHLRSLVSRGYIDAVERAVHQVALCVDNWIAAMASLGQVLRYDAASCDAEVLRRTKELLERLLPKTLESRMRFLVTEMPWDFPFGEKPYTQDHGRRQEEALRELAVELARQPDILERALPELTRGHHRKVFIFGEVLGQLAELGSPATWLKRIIRATSAVPDTTRNLGLLSGYCIGLAERLPEVAEPIKAALTQSSVLSPAFPPVCVGLGVVESDIGLAVDALRAGRLRPAEIARWGVGSALAPLAPSSVAPLFDALQEHAADEASTILLELLAMHLHVVPDAFDPLRPQVRKCIEKCLADGSLPTSAMDMGYFEQLATLVLDEGRGDADACAIALELAKVTVANSCSNASALSSSLTRQLLSDFPEVVWPLVGAAIVSDRDQATLLTWVLGAHMRRDERRPILSLPETTLFSWCHGNPDEAPSFAASVIPVLAEQQDSGMIVHPILRRLVDEFGERTNVLDAIETNIYTFSWSGSLTEYYGQYIDPIGMLTNHQIPSVRTWARRMIRQLRAEVERARDHDAELNVEMEI